MLSDAERERYGRVAAEAYFNGVAPFATELWDAFNDIDTREWFLRSAEAVISAYREDQQARQAAMERVIAAAQGVADSFHAVSADSRGRVRWEVDAVKMRALHIALANCRAHHTAEEHHE